MNKKTAPVIRPGGGYLDIIVIIPLLLSLFGLIIVRSATRTLPGGGLRTVVIQAIGIALGCVIVFFISKLNFKTIKHFGAYIFLVIFALLVLVLLIGTGEELGSRSWINIGFTGFQPAEIAKIAFIVICAIFLERIKKKQDIAKNYSKLFIYSGIIIILILLQKDYGMVAVFIFILLVMLFIAGINIKLIIASLGIILLSAPAFWFFFLNDARKNRIRVFLNPELDPLDAGWNVLQSKLAIGSGRLLGQGLFDGYLNNRGLVPVKESDFIFAVIGEELGFIGTTVIILLFAIFLYRILRLARTVPDTFHSMVCYGIFAMFAFHFIQNVSMTIGLLPVTGLPLPFISAGGTALLSYFTAVGILAAVSRDKGS